MGTVTILVAISSTADSAVNVANSPQNSAAFVANGAQFVASIALFSPAVISSAATSDGTNHEKII